jgi:hypothetical protein
MKIATMVGLLFLSFFVFSCENKNKPNASDSSSVQDSIPASLPDSSASTVAVDSSLTSLTACPLNDKNTSLLNKLQDTLLRNQLSCFEFITIPFSPKIQSEDSGVKQITSRSFLKKYFSSDDESFEGEENAMNPNSYFVGYIFELPSSIGVIMNRHYYPGAFGIDNTFSELYVFDYSGKRISQKTLGCNCYDSNMGSNEINATYDSIVVQNKFATVYSKITRDQLLESTEGEELPKVEYSEKSETKVVNY